MAIAEAVMTHWARTADSSAAGVLAWQSGTQLAWIADDSPGQPVRLARGLSFWSGLDAQDLALPGAEAEPWLET